MSQRAVTSLNWTTDIKKISIKIIWKKRKGDILVKRKENEDTDHFLEEEVREKREYWEEQERRKQEDTLREKED